jgi:hypothetical protein
MDYEDPHHEAQSELRAGDVQHAGAGAVREAVRDDDGDRRAGDERDERAREDIAEVQIERNHRYLMSSARRRVSSTMHAI